MRQADVILQANWGVLLRGRAAPEFQERASHT